LNILTKICIVVLVVLVLVACTVFINMATEPQSWRQYYNMEKQKADLNLQAARYEKLHAERLSQELKESREKATGLAADLAAARKDRVPTPEQIMAAELRKTLDEQHTKLTALQADANAMVKRNQALSDQLEEKRKTIEELQNDTRKVHTENTELRGKLERADRVVRSLQRQLQDRDERIHELEQQVARGPVGAGEGIKSPTTGAKVAGTVTTVRGELASINIGAAQGVTRGMKLYIYRNDRFVGYITVSEVEEGEAAGVISDKQVDVLPGDQVTNDLLK
jgi:myosin heavy subunit